MRITLLWFACLCEEKMIIVKLMGGLGNQMFQYALGRSLAFERKVPLKLDITWFQKQNIRSYQLDRFNTCADIASQEDVEKLIKPTLGGVREKIYRAIQRLLPYYSRRIVAEKDSRFDSHIIDDVTRNAYLVGYWQSEKYFKTIADILHLEFINQNPPIGKNIKLFQMINDSNSVCLHVRRGDYLSSPLARQILGVCGVDYYQKCIQIIVDEVTNPLFFVFSDDMEWVKTNLNITYPVIFVDHNSVNDETEDFRLMKTCKHHIIANSTFSWWAAWLSLYSKKKIFAPQQWFRDDSFDSQDLIPSSWIRI
jgi:hypothetical protein